LTVRLDVLKEPGEEMNFWINGPRKFKSSERNTMLWTRIVILVVLWLLGFLGHVGGGAIHSFRSVSLKAMVRSMFPLASKTRISPGRKHARVCA
jgi:Family of unknown function (DUF5670)